MSCSLDAIRSAAPLGSQALLSYLAAVYGEADATSAAARWAWEDVDVIYKQFLPVNSVRCDYSQLHANLSRFSLFAPPVGDVPVGTLWIYDRESTCLSGGSACEPYKGDAVDAGGSLEVNGFWTEVVHSYRGAYNLWVHKMEREGFWLYKARGSGVWYNTGRTLVVADRYQLALWINASWPAAHSHGPRPRAGETHPYYWTREARRAGYDTVIFTHHIDPGTAGLRVRGVYRAELVGLRSSSMLSCPRDAAHIAWGLHARQPCHCERSNEGRRAVLYNPCTTWPFQSLRCNTSAPGLAQTQTCTGNAFALRGVKFSRLDCAALQSAGLSGDISSTQEHPNINVSGSVETIADFKDSECARDRRTGR